MQGLVTGGAGYIGSHAVRALQRAGHQPVVLDNLVYGHLDIAATLGVPLIEGQVGDRALLDSLLAGDHPALAGTAAAGRPIGANTRAIEESSQAKKGDGPKPNVTPPNSTKKNVGF